MLSSWKGLQQVGSWCIVAVFFDSQINRVAPKSVPKAEISNKGASDANSADASPNI